MFNRVVRAMGIEELGVFGWGDYIEQSRLIHNIKGVNPSKMCLSKIGTVDLYTLALLLTSGLFAIFIFSNQFHARLIILLPHRDKHHTCANCLLIYY